MTVSRLVLALTFCLATNRFAGTALADESNVYVKNTTNSTIMLVLDYVLDANGQKISRSATWMVEPGKESLLTINGENLITSQVGFAVETTFGVRTPTAPGKVWFQDSEGSGADAKVQITITEEMVYKLPESKAELQVLLESLEGSVEVIGREVRYYERLKDTANDDYVLMSINATAYFEALARYQRAVNFHQAVVTKLARIE